MPRLVRLPYNGKDLLFIFGPYRDQFPGTYGVKLTENHQLAAKCDYHFPIPDYGVPRREDFQVLLAKLILLADDGHVPYVGCFGGIGRTGMVVAALARVLKRLGGDAAIRWTRANYLGHAVETREQERLVREFDVAAVRRAVREGKPLAASCITRYLGNLFGNARRQADDTTRFS